jgi:hypothetical protein
MQSKLGILSSWIDSSAFLIYDIVRILQVSVFAVVTGAGGDPKLRCRNSRLRYMRLAALHFGTLVALPTQS